MLKFFLLPLLRLFLLWLLRVLFCPGCLRHAISKVTLREATALAPAPSDKTINEEYSLQQSMRLPCPKVGVNCPVCFLSGTSLCTGALLPTISSRYNQWAYFPVTERVRGLPVVDSCWQSIRRVHNCVKNSPPLQTRKVTVVHHAARFIH